MKSGRLVVILLLGIVPLMEAAEEGELCWEKCFRSGFGTEAFRYKDVYEEVLQMVLDIKRIVNLNKITKIGYLVDTSTSDRHDPAFNPGIMSNTFTNHSSDYLFFFQFVLNHVLLFGIDNAPYFAQFDETSAWGCQGYQCYPSNCNLTRVMRWWSPMQTGPSSHCPNNMEAGCNLLGNYMTTLPCAKAPSPAEKGLLIAIVNSDFTSLMNPLENLDKICPKFLKGASKGRVSACQKYFDHRYVIGIHKASEKVVRKFATGQDYYKMLPENIFSYGAVKYIYDCVNRAGARPCCSSGGMFLLSPVKCDQTAGSFGETIVDYPTFPALINNLRFLPQPL